MSSRRPDDRETAHGRATRPEVREEAALPLRADHPAPDAADERQTGVNVTAFALLLIIVVSVALEYGGWQIALDQPDAAAAAIDWTDFVRGALDTMLGAVAVGAAGAVAPLLIPSTWRRPVRRIALGFLGGATAFLGFLSLLTLSYLF